MRKPRQNSVRWSLSAKITASLGGLLLGLSAVITVLTFVQMRRSAIEQMQSLADTMNYTFEILMSPEALPSLQRVVENDATNRGVNKIVIVDRGGLVRASSARMEVGRQLAASPLRSFLERAHWERETHLTDKGLVIMQPLRGSGFLGGAFGDIGGAAEMTLSLDVIEADARSAAVRLLAVTLGSLLVLSVILWLVLRALVTEPVRELTSAIAATTALESMPPERNTPTGTSAMRRRLIRVRSIATTATAANGRFLSG